MEGEDGGQGREKQKPLHVTDRQTYTHFIIIYISSAWQGEGKISKNVTDRHFIIIYISPAWQGEGKISKNVTNTQTDRHTLHHYIYISSLAGGRENKQKCDRHTHTHFRIYISRDSYILMR